MSDGQEAAPAPAGRRRVPRRVVVGALLAMVVLGTLLVSAALFSDRTENLGSGLDVGTIDVASAPVTFDLDASGLVPGDVVAAPITFRNDGSLELRYALTSDVDDPALADLLELTVRTDVTTCDAVGAAADGTLLAGPVRLGAPGGEPVLGDPATGSQPGDRVLAPGDAEVLCFRVVLPSGVSESGAAGLTVTATLRVDAEQTAANP